MPPSTDRRSFLLGSLVAVPGLAAARSRFTGRQEAGGFGPGAYTLAPGLCYLNHGAIGTVPRAVQQAHIGYLSVCETNPALHLWGDVWTEAWDRTRAKAAALLGGAPEDVAIQRSTTEAFNVLARGLPLGPRDEVLFSNLNHLGASLCWDHYAEEEGFAVRRFEIPLDRVPAMTAEQLVELHVAAIGDRTRVLVLPHVDNIVGLRHPVRAIAQAARAHGVEWVLVDGAQAVGAFPVEVARLGVDAYATSAHKWTQAPKGLGLLWASAELRAVLRPMIVTWGQARWAGTARVFEDYGTRDLPTILALGDAIDFQAESGIEATTARRRALFDAFRDRADAEPGLEWRSPRSFAMGASLFGLHVDHRDVDALVERLFAEHRIVVRSFGQGFDQIRISPNAANTAQDVDRFFEALREVRRG